MEELVGYVQQNPGNTWVFPCFLYRPTHAPTDAELERQSQDKRPQGLDTRTSPPCEAKTRLMEQLS